jgi:UDP:flavonoid glycosyltransferase YjiC (YdhE family)
MARAGARHLLLAITGHGFGHAAQTAPVIDALRALRPDLRISVRSELPAPVLAQFFPGAAPPTRPVADFGFASRSALEVDVAAAERAFTALHAGFDAACDREAEALRALAPDLVLANVGYVPLAAAARAGIPAVGLSSLNWLGIARGYWADWPAAAAIAADMVASYGAARRFIRPTPAMPMPDFPTVAVGPVARRGADRRAALIARMGCPADTRLVLVSLGGIATELGLAAWPAVPGVRYVVAGLATPARPDMIALDDLGFSHLDCLASVDAVVTKPGYATLAEAACHGIPTLYVKRGRWPEEAHLVTWLEAHGTARELARADLEQGALGPALAALWAQPRRPPVPASGNQQAARLIAALL